MAIGWGQSGRRRHTCLSADFVPAVRRRPRARSRTHGTTPTPSCSSGRRRCSRTSRRSGSSSARGTANLDATSAGGVRSHQSHLSLNGRWMRFKEIRLIWRAASRRRRWPSPSRRSRSRRRNPRRSNVNPVWIVANIASVASCQCCHFPIGIGYWLLAIYTLATRMPRVHDEPSVNTEIRRAKAVSCCQNRSPRRH